VRLTAGAGLAAVVGLMVGEPIGVAMGEAVGLDVTDATGGAALVQAASIKMTAGTTAFIAQVERLCIVSVMRSATLA
jgi:hypothetical protein